MYKGRLEATVALQITALDVSFHFYKFHLFSHFTISCAIQYLAIIQHSQLHTDYLSPIRCLLKFAPHNPHTL